jgi:hypothetical protein
MTQDRKHEKASDRRRLPAEVPLKRAQKRKQTRRDTSSVEKTFTALRRSIIGGTPGAGVLASITTSRLRQAP